MNLVWLRQAAHRCVSFLSANEDEKGSLLKMGVTMVTVCTADIGGRRGKGRSVFLSCTVCSPTAVRGNYWAVALLSACVYVLVLGHAKPPKPWPVFPC
ncbi:hypothetical protein JZ751_028930 [Albula glossodonta]|uniref:Uncharacterized protein n=1 Tax=Albula glossodonta TaxID=121402 RepID=A0A8T2MUZ6_9TELE|nr:hypothetical protein JZ751_028930 [Albula glossodonta]